MILQIVEHLEHGLVEALAIGHAPEAVDGLGGIGLDIGIELCQRHACIGLGCRTGMLHVEMGGQRLAVSHEVSDLLGCLPDIFWRNVLIGGIV